MRFFVEIQNFSAAWLIVILIFGKKISKCEFLLGVHGVEFAHEVLRASHHHIIIAAWCVVGSLHYY